MIAVRAALCVGALLPLLAACISPGAGQGSCDGNGELHIRPTRSVEDLKERLTEEPADLSARLELGREYTFLRHYDDAYAEFARVLQAEPNCPAAQVAWGLALNESVRRARPGSFLQDQSETFDQAVRKYVAALALDNRNKEAYAAWGYTLFTKSTNNPLLLPADHPDPIFEKYLQAIKIDQDYEWALSELAEAYIAYAAFFTTRARHLRKNGVATVDGQAQSSAKSAVNYDRLAENYLKNAFVLSERAAKLAPQNVSAQFRWGRLLLLRHRADEAVSVLRPIAENSSDKDVLRKLARELDAYGKRHPAESVIALSATVQERLHAR